MAEVDYRTTVYTVLIVTEKSAYAHDATLDQQAAIKTANQLWMAPAWDIHVRSITTGLRPYQIVEQYRETPALPGTLVHERKGRLSPFPNGAD